MLQANKVFHYTLANQSGNVYGVAFLQKTFVLNHLGFHYSLCGLMVAL